MVQVFPYVIVTPYSIFGSGTGYMAPDEGLSDRDLGHWAGFSGVDGGIYASDSPSAPGGKLDIIKTEENSFKRPIELYHAAKPV